MTTVAILPISDANGGTSYRAIAGEKYSGGKTAGRALDALTDQLGETEFSALLVIQSFRPDSLALEKQHAESRSFMKKEFEQMSEDDLRKEYDFARMQGGVRGKYAERYQQGTNLVLLAPDVAKAFPTEESVNRALRLLLEIAQRQRL